MCSQLAIATTDERSRLEEVARYRILDTPSEQVFDDLVHLASVQFGMPVALITILGKHQQFFKAAVGTSVRSMDRDLSFCSHCIRGEGGMVVPDAQEDERFSSNPLVTGEHNVRFYAGYPLLTASGVKLGTFCVLDQSPHHDFDPEAQTALQRFAAIASQLIEGRVLPFALEEAQEKNADLERRSREESAASQAKTDFLSNVSHEIRTPMNGVLGMLQLLNSTSLNEEQRHYVEVAQSSGSTLLALIDDLLDLQKIEAGKTSIESFNFDLFKTLDDVVEMWRIQSRTKGLSFSLSVSPRVPAKLVGDPGRLRQVLNNLLSNALKFTHAGGIQLQVDTVALSASSAELRFAVTDSGIGMTPDQANALFQPFVQADDSTTRKYGGTGLGLFISKRLVELMKGMMGISSAAGEGSTFWFSLLLARQPSQANGGEDHNRCFDQRSGHSLTQSGVTTPLQKASAHGDVSGDQSTRNSPAGLVLVAEDNATNQLVVRAQLHKLGYEAIVVADGEEAVEAVRQRRFSAILMDCEMPKVDGFQATRRIRELGHDTPIIAVTAHAMAVNREACIEAGMNYYLSKPLDMGRLSRTLEMWCKPVESLPSAEPMDLAPPAAHLRVFDRSSLLERLMNDERLAQTVLHAFIGDFPRQLAVLGECANNNDAEGLRLQAHALKGAAATVSAVELQAVAYDLENSAQDPKVYAHLGPKVEAAYQKFQRELDGMGWSGSC